MCADVQGIEIDMDAMALAKTKKKNTPSVMIEQYQKE